MERPRVTIPGAIGFVCRVGLGVSFLLSAVPKLQMPYQFLSSIYGYEIVGPLAGIFLAVSLPWLEIVLAILLLGDIFVGPAFLLSALLSSLFVFAQGSALYHGLDISCGCFSQAEPDMVSFVTLGKTSLLFLVAVLAYTFAVVKPNFGKLQRNMG